MGASGSKVAARTYKAAESGAKQAAAAAQRAAVPAGGALARDGERLS
jgi:hypothetical protein